MAANEIKLRIKVEDDGGLSIVGKKAKQTSKDIDKLGKSTDKATKSQNNFDRGLKGVGQGGLSAAKGFSKMRDEMGGSSGLVAAYATLAANVFAATAAFGALKRAAEVQTMISALEEIGEASGRSLKVLASNIREITNGAISMEQALKTASIGTSAGFDSSTLQDLAKVARLAATALGRDVGDATDRLTRGVAKLEPEILDELGIMVRLDDATRKYAASMGVAVDSLSTFERSQAFANATIDQGLSKFSDVEGIELSGFTKLAATFSDLGQAVLGFVATALEPLAEFLANSKVALAGLIAVLSQGIVNQALPFIQQFTQKAREAAAAALQAAGAAKTLSFTQQMGAGGGGTGGGARLVSGAKELVGALQRGENVRENSLALEKKLNNSLSKRIANNKRNAKLADTTEKKAALKVKRREAAEIRLDRILLKRAQRNLDSPDFKSMEQRTAFADAETGILGSLDEDMSFDNLKKQFGEARKAGAKYRKETVLGGTALSNFMLKIPLLGKGLLIGGRAFTSFGIAGKVALKGISYAIPYLGQILLGVELLKAAFSKLVDLFTRYGPVQSEASKAQEEAAQVLENYGRVMKGVNEETDTASEVIIKVGNATKESAAAIDKSTKLTIKARKEMGLFGRIADKIKTQFKAMGQDIENFFRRAGLTIEILALKSRQIFLETLDALKGGLQPLSNLLAKVFGLEPVPLINEKDQEFLDGVEADIAALENMRGKIQDFGKTGFDAAVYTSAAFRGFSEAIIGGQRQAEELERIIGKTNIQTVTFGKAIMEGGDALEGYSAELIAMRNARDEDNDGLLDSTEAQLFFNDLIQESAKNIVAQADALQSLRSVIKDSAEDFGKFFATLKGSKTPFTDVSGRLETMTRNMDEFLDASERNLTKPFEALAEEVDKLTDEQKDFLGVQGLTGIELRNQLKLMRSLLRDADERVRSEKRLLSVQKRYSSAAKLASKENTAASELGLKAADQTARISRTRLQGEVDLERRKAKVGGEALGDRLITQELINSASDGEMAALQRIAEKEEKINTLSGNILGTKGIQLTTEKLINQQKQNALKVDQQIAAANEKILKAQQVIQNIAGGRAGAQTEVQKFEAQVRAAEVGLKAAKAEVGFTKTRLDLETRILGIKLRALTDDEALIKQILDEQKELNAETIRAAEAKADAAEAELTSLKLSRHIAADIAIGMEASANKITAIMDAIAGAGSRYNMEVGSGGVLTGLVNDLQPGGKREQELLAKRNKAQQANTPSTAFGFPVPLDPEEKQKNDEIIASTNAELNALPAKLIYAQGAVAQSYLSMVAQGVRPFQEELKKLGPQGEYAAALGEAALVFSSAWINAFTEVRAAQQKLGEMGIKGLDDLKEISGASVQEIAKGAAAVLSAISSTISATQQIFNAAMKNKLAGVDKLIEAEKKQDGVSAKSVAKLKQLEAKKEALKRKEFETNKKMNLANAVISTAAGIAAAFSSNPIVGFILGPIIAAMGAKQVALIKSMQYNGGPADVSAPQKSVQMGKRGNSVDVSGRASAGELAFLRGGRGIGTGANNFNASGGYPPAFYGKKMRAYGGAVAGYTVGEQGPEVFVPQVPGRVVPNDEAVGGAPISVNFNVQAIDSASFTDALTVQRGNIIEIIREAANSSGAEFLESVDTLSLQMENVGGISSRTRDK